MYEKKIQKVSEKKFLFIYNGPITVIFILGVIIEQLFPAVSLSRTIITNWTHKH